MLQISVDYSFCKRWLVALLTSSCLPALCDIFLLCGRCVLCHLTMRVAGICFELVIYFCFAISE